MALRLEDDFGVNFSHQSTYIAPNSFITVGPGSGAVFGGPIVRPQVTNMLVSTEDFSNAVWVKSGVVVNADQTEGPSGSMADAIVWQSTSGNVYQDGLQSIVASGYIYSFSVYLKGISNGQVAHIGIGGDIFWKNEPVVLTTNWQRYEVFGMHEKGPSGSVVRARIYPTQGSLVYAWGGQLEIGPSATDYIAATGLVNVTRPIQYETDCIYVPRSTSNYYKNNTPPLAASWSTVAGSVSTALISSPVSTQTTRFTINSSSSNHAIFTENTPISSDVVKISCIVKPENSFGVYSYSLKSGPLNSYLYSNICDNRVFVAGSQNATGFIQQLGDGWALVDHVSTAEITGSRNEFGLTSYGRGNFPGTILSPVCENILFGSVSHSRELGTTPIVKNASTSGSVLEDILTTPIGSYLPEQGSFLIDAYIDSGIGVATDSARRTILDASSSSSSTNRILLFKDLAINKYNLEIYNATGGVSSGTITLQLSIGWHRFGVTYSSGSCSLWIDGVKRLNLSGATLSEVGTIKIGGSKFSASQGWGAWIKNFYSFRTSLSDSLMADYTGLTRTGYDSYRSEQTIVRRYQMWIDPNMFPGTFGTYPWKVGQAAGTGTITSGIIDPLGGTGAYRIIAGNAPATRNKVQYAELAFTNTINSLSIPAGLGLQSPRFTNYYTPTTRSYSTKVWARANLLTPQPRFETNSPQGTSIINIGSLWQLISFPETTPTTVGSLVILSISVPTEDQATGTVDVELFNPLIDVNVSIRTETISPKSSDIPLSSGMIYKLKCAGNINHGHTGTYESNYTDMGRNTSGTPYLGIDIVDSIPDGSSIVYEYFASDVNTATPIWRTSVEEISGRYFKVKIYLQSEDVESVVPEVVSIRPRPKFS